MSTLSYSGLNDALVAACPELAAELTAMREDWAGEEPGPHVVFGDIFAAYLVQLATQPDGEDAAARRRAALAFLERLACDPDMEVRCVAQVSVLESVLDRPGAFRRVEAEMGPCTLRLSREVARSWGRTIDDFGEARAVTG